MTSSAPIGDVRPSRVHLVAACGHLLTAIVGAGVLSVPYAASWLGWVAFPPVLLATLLVSAIYASLLCAAAGRAGVGGIDGGSGGGGGAGRAKGRAGGAEEGGAEDGHPGGHARAEGGEADWPTAGGGGGHGAAEGGGGRERAAERGWECPDGLEVEEGPRGDVGRDALRTARGTGSPPVPASVAVGFSTPPRESSPAPLSSGGGPRRPLLHRHHAHRRRRPQTYSQLTRAVLGPGAGVALAALQLTINALACFAYAIAAIQALQGLGIGGKPWSEQGDALAPGGEAAAGGPLVEPLSPASRPAETLLDASASQMHVALRWLADRFPRFVSALSPSAPASLRHLPGPPHPLEGSPTAALLFAGVQMLLACSGGMAESWWSSAVGAAAALCYAVGTAALAAPKARATLGSARGRRAATAIGKTLGVSRALGTLAFAFAFPTIAVEVQASLGKLAARDARSAGRACVAVAGRPGGLAQALGRRTRADGNGVGAREAGLEGAPGARGTVGAGPFAQGPDSALLGTGDASSASPRISTDGSELPQEGRAVAATRQPGACETPAAESAPAPGAVPSTPLLDASSPPQPEAPPRRRAARKPKLEVTRSMPVDVGRWFGELGARGPPPVRPRDGGAQRRGEGDTASGTESAAAPPFAAGDPATPRHRGTEGESASRVGSSGESAAAGRADVSPSADRSATSRTSSRPNAATRFFRAVFGLGDAEPSRSDDSDALSESALENGTLASPTKRRGDDAEPSPASLPGSPFPPCRHRPFSNDVEEPLNPLYGAIKPGTVTFGALFCRQDAMPQGDSRDASRDASTRTTSSGGDTPRGAERPSRGAVWPASRTAAARWGLFARGASGPAAQRGSEVRGLADPLPSPFSRNDSARAASPASERSRLQRPLPRGLKAHPSMRFSSSSSFSSLQKAAFSFPASSASSDSRKAGAASAAGALIPTGPGLSPFDAPAPPPPRGVSTLFGLLPWLSRAIASLSLLPPTQAERRALAEEAYTKGLLQRERLRARAEADGQQIPGEYDYYQEYVASRRAAGEAWRGAAPDGLAWTPSGRLVEDPTGSFPSALPSSEAPDASLWASRPFGPPTHGQHRPGGGLGYGLRPVSLASFLHRSWSSFVGGKRGDLESCSRGPLTRDASAAWDDGGLDEPLLSRHEASPANGADSFPAGFADGIRRRPSAREVLSSSSALLRPTSFLPLPSAASLVAAQTMRRAVLVSLLIAGVLYAAVGALGYAAFGDAVASDVLSQPSLGPFWAVRAADVAVVVHVGPAFQVFALPVFVAIETAIAKAWAATQARAQARRDGNAQGGGTTSGVIGPSGGGGASWALPRARAEPRLRWTVWRENSRDGMRYSTADDEAADELGAGDDGGRGQAGARPGSPYVVTVGRPDGSDEAIRALRSPDERLVPLDSAASRRALVRVPTRRNALAVAAAQPPSPFVFPNPVTYHIDGRDVHALHASEAARYDGGGGSGWVPGRDGDGDGGAARAAPSGLRSAFPGRARAAQARLRDADGGGAVEPNAVDVRASPRPPSAASPPRPGGTPPLAPLALPALPVGSALSDSEGKALLLESPPFIGPALAAELAAAEDRAWGYEAPLLGHKGVKRADDGSEVPRGMLNGHAVAGTEGSAAPRPSAALARLDDLAVSAVELGLFPASTERIGHAFTAQRHAYTPVLFSPAVQAASGAERDAAARPSHERISAASAPFARAASAFGGLAASSEEVQPDEAARRWQRPGSGSLVARPAASSFVDAHAGSPLPPAPPAARDSPARPHDAPHDHLPHPPPLPAFVRLPLRWSLVALATVLALRKPSFGAAAGAIGALVFWPLGVFLPTLLFLKTHPETTPLARGALVVAGAVLLVVAVAMLLGAVGGALGWAA